MTTDFFGVPEYYVTRVIECEAAGGGNMRVYCCATRGNEMMPVFTVVMSISDMLEASSFVRQRAAEIWNETQLVPALVNGDRH